MTPAQLKQMFELAYYYSLPPALRALFGLFDQPAGVKNVYFPLDAEKQNELFQKLLATYAGKMITAIMRDQWGPFYWFSTIGVALRAGFPPANAISLGQSGQYALPGDPTPQPGSLGKYPTTLQLGWEPIPDVTPLLKMTTEAEVKTWLEANFPVA